MKILLATVFLTGCVTSRLVRDEQDLKTIGVKAGIYGEAMYKEDLAKKAREVCGGSYQTVYEGREPKTLQGIYLKYEDYYLVVKCGH